MCSHPVAWATSAARVVLPVPGEPVTRMLGILGVAICLKLRATASSPQAVRTQAGCKRGANGR
eukprot:scaffold516633_cov46-Prasinocladus_malaysianus.AAC.1